MMFRGKEVKGKAVHDVLRLCKKTKKISADRLNI